MLKLRVPSVASYPRCSKREHIEPAAGALGAENWLWSLIGLEPRERTGCVNDSSS
jgi:hypothetical protein